MFLEKERERAKKYLFFLRDRHTTTTANDDSDERIAPLSFFRFSISSSPRSGCPSHGSPFSTRLLLLEREIALS